MGWPWRGGAEDPLPRGGCVAWGDASSLGSGLSILRRSASIGSGPATSRAAPSAGGFCFFSSLFLLLLLSVPFAFAPALPPSSISSPSVTSSVASEPHGAVMEPDILLNKRFFSYGNPGRLPCAFLLPWGCPLKPQPGSKEAGDRAAHRGVGGAVGVLGGTLHPPWHPTCGWVRAELLGARSPAWEQGGRGWGRGLGSAPKLGCAQSHLVDGSGQEHPSLLVTDIYLVVPQRTFI